jgi:ribonuclease D
MFTLIESEKDLQYLNEELLECPFLGLDTEFRRTTKNNMKLALLQVNDYEEIYLIDCLKIKEPVANCSFLFSEKVKKIFHSCREDLDAIFSWTQQEMVNIFDTQLANAFLGGSHSISYKRLVNDKFGLTIDKKETRTNWLRRPLTDAQLDYAASDVEFLLEIYYEQIEELIKSNKFDWLEEELVYVSSKISIDPIVCLSEKRDFNITRQEEKNLLDKFNEIVLNISRVEKINPTLLFSKRSQRDFLKLIINFGLEEAFKKITPWRRSLINKPLSRIVTDTVQL